MAWSGDRRPTVVLRPDGKHGACALQVCEQRFSIGTETRTGPFAAFLSGVQVLSETVDLVAAAAQQMEILGAAAVLADDQVVAGRRNADVVDS